MLLVIDAGNTQTVIGMYDGPELMHHWRIATNAERTADEHALLVSNLLDLLGYDAEQIVTGLSMCSSVPSITAALRDMAERWYSVKTVVLEGEETDQLRRQMRDVLIAFEAQNRQVLQKWQGVPSEASGTEELLTGFFVESPLV